MNKNINSVALSLFLIAGIFISCHPGDDVIGLLKGEWVVKDVIRRGKSTNTLNGLSFEFREDSVITNLPNIGRNLYEFHSDSITIQTDPPLKFNIQQLDTNNLVLSGNIRNTPFILKFNRIRP